MEPLLGGIQSDRLVRTKAQTRNNRNKNPNSDPITAPITAPLLGDELAIGAGVGVGLAPRTIVDVKVEPVIMTQGLVGVASARAVSGNPGIPSVGLGMFARNPEQ